MVPGNSKYLAPWYKYLQDMQPAGTWPGWHPAGIRRASQCCRARLICMGCLGSVSVLWTGSSAHVATHSVTRTGSRYHRYRRRVRALLVTFLKLIWQAVYRLLRVCLLAMLFVALDKRL